MYFDKSVVEGKFSEGKLSGEKWLSVHILRDGVAVWSAVSGLVDRESLSKVYVGEAVGRSSGTCVSIDVTPDEEPPEWGRTKSCWRGVWIGSALCEDSCALPAKTH